MRLNYLSVLFPLLAAVDNSQLKRKKSNCRRQELSVKEHRRSRQDGRKLNDRGQNRNR